MPVMRHLNVGGTTYDTVGEASVTQVLGSGTKIATVSIDGTATDIYAPEGGSSVDPATAAPSMDGTAAVGSSVKYAREDHVHPHDTSRLSGVTLDTSADTYVVPATNGVATVNVGDGLSVSDSGNKVTVSVKTGTTSTTVAAGNHTHTVAGINGLQSALDAKQATLVSGTNIKTINNESLLGSGNITTPTYTLPTASTSTLGGVKVDGTTITAAADGTISASGGGGGGMYDLVIHVTLNDAATAVISHDADYSECMAFVEAIESGDDLSAVAICRNTAYDDEDNVYNAGAMVLPLVQTDSVSYGMGQYKVDGGWSLMFVSIYNVTSAGKANGFGLTVSGTNDDPQLEPTVTFKRL